MLKLELKIEEVNMILAALGKQPFEVVFSVVENIQKQAKWQLEAEAAKSDASVTKAEVVSGAVN